MDIVYKLKHKPTGLYYQPVKGRWTDDKTNLSKTGKIYTSLANAKSAGSVRICISKSQIKKTGSSYRETPYGNIIDTESEDWEIEKFTLTLKL